MIAEDLVDDNALLIYCPHGIRRGKVPDKKVRKLFKTGLWSGHSRRENGTVVQVIADESVLQEMVRRLVDAIDPDRIILFGTRARGDARPDSDVDLLIIKDSDELPHKRSIPAYRALGRIPAPADILWRIPEEVEEWAGVRNYVTTRAIREGRVLYEKRA